MSETTRRAVLAGAAAAIAAPALPAVPQTKKGWWMVKAAAPRVVTLPEMDSYIRLHRSAARLVAAGDTGARTRLDLFTQALAALERRADGEARDGLAYYRKTGRTPLMSAKEFRRLMGEGPGS